MVGSLGQRDNAKAAQAGVMDSVWQSCTPCTTEATNADSTQGFCSSLLNTYFQQVFSRASGCAFRPLHAWKQLFQPSGICGYSQSPGKNWSCTCELTALRGDAAAGTQKETASAPPVPAPVIPHERHRGKESSSSGVCQQKGERGT